MDALPTMVEVLQFLRCDLCAVHAVQERPNTCIFLAPEVVCDCKICQYCPVDTKCCGRILNVQESDTIGASEAAMMLGYTMCVYVCVYEYYGFRYCERGIRVGYFKPSDDVSFPDDITGEENLNECCDICKAVEVFLEIKSRQLESASGISA